MAAQGVRDTGDGIEKIANATRVAELRARARTVNALTLASAVVTTTLVIIALAV